MHVAGMLLGCLLLAPASDAQKARAAEIVAEAMQLPAGSAVTGQRLTLLAAISSASTRDQQLTVVRAYWRLVEAEADYVFSSNHLKGFERIGGHGRHEASLRLAATAAAAQLRDAELATVRAQYELAEAARLPANSPPPLPADAPLVVPYNTEFNRLFAARTPPDGARLADKTLPIQHQAIEDRAVAVQAADDALSAVLEDYRSGRGDAAAVVTCSRELLRQQRAFIETVCAYNRNIAGYALLVVAPTTTPQDLVKILIGSPAKTAAPAGSGGDQSVRATSATEPIGTVPSRPASGQPTLAPPRPVNEPAPPRGGWGGGDTAGSAASSPLPGEKTKAPWRPPQPDPPSDAPAVLEGPMTPIDALPVPSKGTQRKAYKPPIRPPASMGDLDSPTAGRLPYAALVAEAPAARAKQLAAIVYANRSLPKDAGRPLGLADCLLRDGSGDHRATVEAYWLVGQRASQCQTLAEQAELLGAIEPLALHRRNELTGAADMLRLQAARLAARAAGRESQVALVEAQYDLALRIGALSEPAWPLASTLPHTGGYLLEIDSWPASLTESWPMRRLVAMMPGLGKHVRQCAAEVVDADALRAAAVDRYAARGGGIDQTIEAVAGQTERTFAFLEAAAAYNRAIAEYATTVLPPESSPDNLVAALVTKP